MTVDGLTVTLSILDTAGQEDFIGLRNQQMREKDGFLFVYAINNRATFDDLDTFYDILMDITETEVGIGHMKPLVMVGNKVDCNDFEVTCDEANDVSRQYKAVNHIYTSALTGYNINKMIVSLIRSIISQKYPSNREDHIRKPSNDVNCKICSIM